MQAERDEDEVEIAKAMGKNMKRSHSAMNFQSLKSLNLKRQDSLKLESKYKSAIEIKKKARRKTVYIKKIGEKKGRSVMLLN